MAVWWSSVLFLLVAALAFSRSRDLGTAQVVGSARHWRAAAALFVWISFDHSTHAHVEVARRAQGFLQISEGTEPLTLLLLAVAVVIGRPLYRSSDRETRRQLLVATALLLAGGLGVDLVVQLTRGGSGLASQAVESGLTWAGVAVLVAAFGSPSRLPRAKDSA
jgi:hypothetical protein